MMRELKLKRLACFMLLFMMCSAGLFAFSPSVSATPIGTILIEGGAAWSGNLNVTLNLSCPGLGGVHKMSFSNNNVTYSSEEDYVITKAWTLTTGAPGIRTVWVKYRDGVPGSLPSYANDTISYYPLNTTAATSVTDLAAVLNGDTLDTGINITGGFIYKEGIAGSETNVSLGRVDVKTLYEHWDATGGNNAADTYVQVYGVNQYKQEFQLGATGPADDIYVKAVKIKIYRLGSPGTATVKVTYGLGSGTTVCSTTINGSSLSTIPTWYTINFSSPYPILSHSTHYFIIVSAASGSAGNEIRWSADSGNYPFDNPHYRWGSTSYYMSKSSNSGVTFTAMWGWSNYGVLMFGVFGAKPNSTTTFSHSLTSLNSTTLYYFKAWGQSVVYLEGFWMSFTTLSHPTIMMTPSGTMTPLAWKNSHNIQISIDYAYPFDAWFGISNPWANNYIYMTGYDMSSLHYNTSLHQCSGAVNFSIDGSKWVPFYDHYTVEIRLYTAGYPTYYSTNRTFNISGTAGFATEVSLSGFIPIDGYEEQYTQVGKSVVYEMMTNKTNPADTVTPHAHLFLTQSDGVVIRAYHSDFSLWSSVPFMDSMGKFSVFQKEAQWASQLEMNKDYCFYIGFSETKWTSANLDLQLLYDDATVLEFHGNNYNWWDSISRLYDDNTSSGYETQYYGIKISFGTWTSSDHTGGITGAGDVTGGTWGPSLGAQVDAATGISGSSMVVGIFVVAIFAFMPVIITHTSPPLPITILFAGMGLVMSFGMGFFPIWIFFIIVVIVCLIIVYKIKGWATQSWGSEGGALSPLKDAGSRLKDVGVEKIKSYKEGKSK